MLPLRRFNFFLAVTLLPGFLLCSGCRAQPEPPQEKIVSVSVAHPYYPKKLIQDYDVYTGLVEAGEDVEVRAKVQTFIKEVPFKAEKKEGEEVKAGEMLFLLDDAPYQADKEAAVGDQKSWMAKKKFAVAQYERYEELAKKNAASIEDVQKARASMEEAIAGIDIADAKIKAAQTNIDYCKITAPIDGQVGQALLTKGNLVNAAGTQSLLTTVVSVDPMYVYFYVNERARLDYLEQSKKLADKKKNKTGAKNGKTPPIEVKMALGTNSEFTFKGTIDFVDNRVDPSTGSLKIRASFKNPKGPDGYRLLTPGLFAKVRVEVRDPYEGLLVADQVIMTDQNQKYVWVVNKEKPGNPVEKMPVELGRLQDKGLRVVQGKLTKDHWIIIKGLNKVHEQVKTDPVEETMTGVPEEKLENSEKGK